MIFEYRLSINGVEQETFTKINIENIVSDIDSENKKPMLRHIARYLQSIDIITTETNLLYVRNQKGDVFKAIVLCWIDGTLSLLI